VTTGAFSCRCRWATARPSSIRRSTGCTAPNPDPGLAGNVDHWPRGRVLGGSSSINAMVWVRGHRSDFDDWRDAGNPGWGADEMCSAFRDVECADRRRRHPARTRKGPLNLFVPGKTTHHLTRKWFRISPGHRPAAQSGFQRRKPGWRRPVRIHHSRRPAAVGSPGLPPPGDETAQSQGDHRRAGDRPDVRRRPRNRRDLQAAGRSGDGERRPRGDPQRRLGQLAAAPAARGHRSGASISRISASMSASTTPMSGAISRTISASITPTAPIARPSTSSSDPWWGKLSAGIRYLAFRDGPLSVSLNQAGGFIRTSPDRVRPNMQLYFQAFSTVIPRPGERPILSPDPWPGLLHRLVQLPSEKPW
jgi:choline dehydrogenase